MTNLRKNGVAALTLLTAASFLALSSSYAEAPNPPGDAGAPATPGSNEQLSKLLQETQQALKDGNTDLALIQLKNAVRVAPGNGQVRARLGILLLAAGDAGAAERELRQAIQDGAAKATTLPALFQAMLSLREFRDLLKEFPDPGAAKDETAADVLRARAVAFQAMGESKEASDAIDRSLALRRDLPGLLTRAHLAQQQGDYDLAAKAVDEALVTDAHNVEALLLKAELRHHAGDDDASMALTTQLIKDHPQNAPAKLLQIGLLLDLKQDDKASQVVAELLKQSPKLPTALYYQALMKARAKDLAAAWQTAQTLPPDFVQSQPGITAAVAQMALGSGNPESAGAIITAALAKNPNPSDPALQELRILLAVVRLQQNKPADALAAIAPDRDSTNPRVLALLAQASMAVKNYGDAIAYLEKANTSAGDNEILRRQLALTELQAGHTDQGIQQLSDMVAHDPDRPEAAGLLIAALSSAGRFDEALAAADRLRQKNSKSPWPAFYRGQIDTLRGKYPEADADLAASIEADPKFTPARYYRAQAAMSQGDLARATAELDEILKQDPNNISALIKRAELSARTDKPAEVIDLLNRALSAAPKDPRPRLALANYQMVQRDYNTAEATLSAAQGAIPDNADVLNLLGEVQIAKGQKDEAVATYRQLVSKLPSSLVALIRLAGAQNAAGDPKGAEASLRQAIKVDPASVTAQHALVDFDFTIGKPDDALTAAQAFSTAHPGPDADLLLAQAFMRSKKLPEAETALKAGLARKADSRLVIALSDVEAKTHTPRDAEATLEKWLADHPDDATVRETYAGTLLQAGDKKSAAEQYELILKQRPKDPLALNNLGWLIQKDQPERAAQLVSQAANIEPRSPAIIDTLGWMKFQAGEKADALPLLQRAHGLNEKDPSITYHLAAALASTGQRDEAKTLLATALASKAPFDDIDDARKLATTLQ